MDSEEANTPVNNHDNTMEHCVELVCAYVTNNAISSADLPQFIQTVHATLSDLASGEVEDAEMARPEKPAVPIKKSIHDEYIICLEDGLKFKSLKRHLGSKFGLSPEEYRARWGLPADYPMVAPAYARRRSQLAKNIGLGKLGKKNK